MSNKKIMKGVSYGRVSTFDQAYYSDGTQREDASPQMQKIKCQKYMDCRKGNYQIIEHLSDDGYSGKDTNRPGFKRLEAYVKSGEIQFVVASELSRLSRNTLDFLSFFKLCRKHNVEVFVIGMDLDMSSPFGFAMVTIVMTFAELERSTTGERVRQNARARLISDGKINGATEVLGLDKCSDRKGHYQINISEVETLKKVFNIFLLTGSRAATLRELEKQQIKWKRGEDFSKAKLELIFKCVKDRYKGRWPVTERDEEIVQYVDLPHGPVLDVHFLIEVEKKLNETKSKKRLPGKNHVYLLSTLLEHEDGSSFSGQPAKQRQYRYYNNQKNKIRIPCADIEEVILKRFEEYISDNGQIKKLVEKAYLSSSDKLKELKIEIAEVERDLKELNRKEVVIKDKLLVTSDYSTSDLFKMLEADVTQINQDRARLLTRLKDLEDIQNKFLEPITTDALRKAIKSFLGQMVKTPNATHRGMLEKFVHKIVVKDTQEIEVIMFGDRVVGENKTTRSSSGGLNGGSNRT